MSVLAALERFADTLTRNFAAPVDAGAEDQLKGPTADLLRAVGEVLGHTVVIRTEARIADFHGRPDLGVTVAHLLAGFVELKAPGMGSDPNRLKGEQNKKQWGTFQAIPNLIYTDGQSWSLYRCGQKTGATVRLKGDITTDGPRAVDEANAEALQTLLSDFLTWEPIVPHTPRDLAHYLAPLTRLLRAEVEQAVENARSGLALLAEEWRGYLFPDADAAQFADAYAQTLTYALLLARISGAEDLSPESAAKTLDAGNGLLAATLRILAHKDARQEVRVGYEVLERSLSALDPHVILKRNPELWLYFYEDFLDAYDRKLRNDYGVYYTPAEIVGCQVRLVAEILDTTFGKRLAFADDGVTFLDPAVGTGTYLVAAVQHALARVRERSGEGAVPARASLLARNMYAFECLVGPYAVAHLRLAQEILSEGGTLPEGRLQVYLADTLESPFTTPPGTLDLAHRPLVEERRRARAVKEQTNVLVCLGNPPYDRQVIERGDTTTRPKGGWVRFGDKVEGGARQESQGQRPILDDFILPAKKAGKSSNIRNLYNDYVYFWRWALWKLFECQETGGIVSFITASSYLTGPGFVGMREVMRRTFDALWIIDLEGDGLGSRKTTNLFAIRTPVAIAVGYCKGQPRRNRPAKVRYAKISGARDDKKARLEAITRFADVTWQPCPSGWHDPFVPQGSGAFFAWPALTDVFPWQHSGIQFVGRWPIGETPEVLEQRWRRLCTLPPDLRATAFVESRDRTIDKVYTSGDLPGSGAPCVASLKSSAELPRVTPYGFRSFDRQVMFFDVRLCDYIRPELVETHGPKQVYLTSLLSGRLGSGSSAVVTDLLPDRHHFSGRGGKDVIPLYRDAEGQNPNLAEGLAETLAEVYERPVRAEDVFAYAYAVLANPGYAAMFWTELSASAPRLPITHDADLFAKIAAIGRKLIHLHTFGNRMIPKGRRAGDVPQGKARCLKAIPPTEADYPDTFSYIPETREIAFGKGRFGPVSPAVWDFEVSGLHVVPSWLSYRRREGAGKKSSPLDAIRPAVWTAPMTDQFLELLWVLEHTVALLPEIQNLLDTLVQGPCFRAEDLLPTPDPRTTRGGGKGGGTASCPCSRTDESDTRQEVLIFSDPLVPTR